MLLFYILGYTSTIKKTVTNHVKGERYGFNYNSINGYDLVCRMKYKVKSAYIKCQKIIIENETSLECLCRVDVNHKLFKIVYLEPNSTVEFLYDQEKITELLVSEI